MRKLLAVVLLSSFAIAAPIPHGIRFTWNQSPSPGVTGNALYCGTASRNYTLTWTFNTPTLTFDWTASDPVNKPVAGTKYYCAVTATAAGLESDYSVEVVGTFPVVPNPPQGLSMTPF